jgi:hypothetical protein
MRKSSKLSPEVQARGGPCAARPIGDIPPSEAEVAHYRQQGTLAVAA